MMADAYSRVGKGFGATMVTSGPGAQNLITGIACSWFDSVPVIHISGQVNSFELSSANQTTKNVRQIGFQETLFQLLFSFYTSLKLWIVTPISFVFSKKYPLIKYLFVSIS